MTEDRAEIISMEISSRIASGDLEPNERLPTERELAVHYNISRAGVRKALDKLEGDGRIVRTVGRGTFVASQIVPTFPEVDLRDISPADLNVARLLIEPGVAAHAALNGTATDLHDIEQCMLKCERAEDIRDFDFWDSNLHAAIASAAHNHFVTLTYRALLQVRQSAEWNKVKVFAVTPERRKNTEADHRGIVEAIKERNGTLAREAMVKHLEHIGRYISQRD
jgi:DNA-binding FadR family transcriptional regulator